MMLAPKGQENYCKKICIKSIKFIDVVWGDCSLIEGETYEILIDAKQNHLDGWYLVKFREGLCPYPSENFKSEE